MTKEEWVDLSTEERARWRAEVVYADLLMDVARASLRLKLAIARARDHFRANARSLTMPPPSDTFEPKC